MPRFERLDVLVVPFPFAERPAVKRRPALLLSTAPFVEADGHGVFAMITSARHTSWPSDLLIEGWRAAGLPRPSRLRLKLFTLGTAQVLGRLGALDDDDRARVDDRLRSALGLAVA
jgi:mRNA interferase MazF